MRRSLICLDKLLVDCAHSPGIGLHFVDVFFQRHGLSQPIQPVQHNLCLRRAGVLLDELLQSGPDNGWIHLQGADQICLGLFPVVRGKILFDKPRLIQMVQHIQHIADEPLRGVRRQLRRWRVLRLDQPIQPCQQRFGFCQVGKYQAGMFDQIVQRAAHTFKITFPHFNHKVSDGPLPGVLGKRVFQNSLLMKLIHKIV